MTDWRLHNVTQIGSPLQNQFEIRQEITLFGPTAARSKAPLGVYVLRKQTPLLIRREIARARPGLFIFQLPQFLSYFLWSVLVKLQTLIY